MNSSMLAGERRPYATKRSGMTVLGKVVVPKPINLPSQRLENNGLDPNVEIVPKGTLGWGNRPSSSGSNPWVSSSLSPNAEGGTISPSHTSDRPSSGGSGTRPSTAGSERTHEPVSGGAWASLSRPSSASGTLSSNQTSSASLRPSSAENRPNSSQSQLSRFADPVSKTSAARSPSVTGERLVKSLHGAKSSKEDGFSLTSGDFPTLGTEKDNSMKNTELEDHGRPSSASGRIAHEKDDTRDQADTKHGTVNTWRADGPQGPEDDINPSMEKWHGDNPQYFNPNAPPQHFDAWRAPPMRGPPGVWYGGRPRGPPPFGSPVGPGGFPMEPFPYYRPQISPPPLVGSQPGPPPGTRGSHPKNGDLYRPQRPDAAYGRPGMSFGPGFYHGTPGPMAFESFYGPPMGYERDIAYMGMAAPPPIYNKSYPGPAPDIGNSHSRDGRGHHALKSTIEQGEVKDTQGPKRIALKNRNPCDQWEEGETREYNLQQSDISYPEKNCLPIIFSRKKEWGAEEDPEEAVHAKKRTPNEKSSHDSEYREHSVDGVNVKSFEGTGNTKAINDNWTNLAENVTPLPLEMPRVPLCSVRDSPLPDVMKKSVLMHKIDGLNAKIRISDGRNDSLGPSNREEVRNRSQIIDTKFNNRTGEVSNTSSRDFVSVLHEVTDSVSDKPIQPMIMSRRPHHGGQVRVDHRGKGKLNSQDADAWRKKPLPTESSSVIMASHNESPTSSHAHGPKNVEDAFENFVNNPAEEVEGDSVESHDSIDIQAQRAKLREIAKQRALQLQKEEEERTKEQRAKALAKLEELNRRTLSGEAGTDKAGKSWVIEDIKGDQDESRMIDGPSMANHSNANQAGEAVEEMQRNLPLESDVATNLPVQEDSHDVSVRKAAPQYNDSRHKRAGYKQKQNSSLQKSSSEKYVSNVAANNDITSGEHYPSNESKPSESSSKQKQNSSLQKSLTGKYVPNVAANNDITSGEHCPSSETKLSESNMSNTSGTVVERPVSHRKKSNRSAKNKHKADETLLPPVESSINPAKEFIEDAQAKDSSSVSTVIEPEPNKAVKAQEVLCSSLPNEESYSSKVYSQWRSHPSRRQPRSQQVNNKPNGGGDTAVWAPVNKVKVSVETSPDAVPETTNLTKGSNNSLKGKRAEMERYVPKPVAKELAQQVYTPNVSVTSSRLNDGSSKEVKEVDIISHNKHRKDQGAWKQRGPLDPSHMKGPNVESQSVKGDFDSVNAEIRTSVKDHGAKDKGKKNTTKGSASTGSNNNNKIDHEKSFRSETDVNQVDKSIGSRENMSHWQPKVSGSNTASNHHGNINESLTTEGNRFPKNEHKAQGGNYNQIQAGQSVNANHNVAQEFGKEKGQPFPPNKDSVAPGELPHEDVHLDRNFPSGSRRNNRNNRPVRGHESRGGWTPGHDNRQFNAPPFRENRQSQNPHYEYQHVGPFKGNRPGRVEEPIGADGMGQRHKERGPRRGGENFNRRQSGAAPAHVVDSGWE